MAESTFIMQGVEELINVMNKIPDKLIPMIRNGIEKAAINTAEDIKIIFKGGASPGFRDRTGALRQSIRGGIDEEHAIEDEITGFIGAGDDSIGFNGKRTKAYVSYIEFGEFSKAGSTSFLRAGVQKNQRQIKKIIQDEIKVENLV